MQVHLIKIFGCLGIILKFATATDSEPALIIQPRDFNPHAYQEGINGHLQTLERNTQENHLRLLSNLYNQGPIQFPKNNDEPAKLSHPYEKLALRERQTKTARFYGPDNEVLPSAYKALAKHAKKILRRDYDDYYEEAPSHYQSKKQYAFSYVVRDRADHSHTQQQINGAVQGRYKVQLPDGRLQVVTYTADDSGYHAQVSYENEVSVPIPSPPPSYAKYTRLYPNEPPHVEIDTHQPPGVTPTPYPIIYHTTVASPYAHSTAAAYIIPSYDYQPHYDESTAKYKRRADHSKS